MLVCVLLVACGSAPEKKNALSVDAIRQSERGAAAFMQGDHVRALHSYGQALRDYQAIEHTSGIAITRINLGRVLRETGQIEQAHKLLDALFVSPVLPYPADSMASAAALQAQLYLEGGEIALARHWLEQGEMSCAKQCQATGSLQLLRAQLALRDEHYAEAAKLVDDALAALSLPQQAVEAANALRLSGEIYFAQGDEARAAARFEQALAADQKLGLPRKVHLDLLGLARSAEHAGRQAEGQNYQARAQAVEHAIENAREVSVPKP